MTAHARCAIEREIASALFWAHRAKSTQPFSSGFVRYFIHFMMNNPTFAVVEFSEESTIAVVSTKWLTSCRNFCHWPAAAGPSFVKLVTKHVDPEISWTRHPCKVLKLQGKYPLEFYLLSKLS
jgi:hypothetical protein